MTFSQFFVERSAPDVAGSAALSAAFYEDVVDKPIWFLSKEVICILGQG